MQLLEQLLGADMKSVRLSARVREPHPVLTHGGSAGRVLVAGLSWSVDRLGANFGCVS
jgi:hypothetical protein